MKDENIWVNRDIKAPGLGFSLVILIQTDGSWFFCVQETKNY